MKLILFLFISTAAYSQYKDSTKVYAKCLKQTEKHTDYVYIPPTSYNRGSNDSDIPSPGFNGYYMRSQVVSVASFFMQKFEVSNSNYLEFLKSKQSSDSTSKWLAPDTLAWRTKYGNQEGYVDYYLRHPAYAKFPVVGVSYDQANAYAQWITDQYNSNEERAFKKVKFRLPTEEEWEVAFKGGNTSCNYLPWENCGTIDEEGMPRANFFLVNQTSIYRDSIENPNSRSFQGKKELILCSSGYRMNWEGHHNYDLTKPVESFEPNGYGLYNMAGNVEEMVDAYYYRDSTAFNFPNEGMKTTSTEPWGVTKGGSWMDTGYYLQYPVRQFYEGRNSSSNEIGFRLVMEVVDF